MRNARRTASLSRDLGTLLLLGVAAPARELPAQAVRSVTVEQAAASIGRATGRPAVVVFYKTTCGLSRAMFPSLAALAREHQSAGVEFLVYSVDADANVDKVPAFLASYSAPFGPVRVERWTPGAFTRAMAGVGIQADKIWTTPLVALRGADGRILMQAQGVTDVSRLGRALP